MKRNVVLSVVFGIFFFGSLPTAGAAIYNSKVVNPFRFCELPKPCRHCHPWRTIYNEICTNQKEAGKGSQSSPVGNSPIIETVDQDGKKWYLRTVDGYTLRSANRKDLEDASLNSDSPITGLEIISEPRDAQLIKQ